MSKDPLILPSDYAEWLARVKQRISGARQHALLSANEEQIRLYHDLGRDILDRQCREKWGARVIDHLSADLRSAFPDMKGFSTRNLKYMKVFAQQCPDRQFGQQSAAQLSKPIADRLPWFHIVTILTKLTDPALREWYAREALSASWPRDTLAIQTKNRLVAEYALSGIDKPIGVADYQLVRALPEPLDTCLPSIEELESELSRDLDEEEKP